MQWRVRGLTAERRSPLTPALSRDGERGQMCRSVGRGLSRHRDPTTNHPERDSGISRVVERLARCSAIRCGCWTARWQTDRLTAVPLTPALSMNGLLAGGREQ